MPAKISDHERPAHFWSYVDRRNGDECWNWTGCRGGFGHGTFWDGRRMEGAHRYAFMLANGPIPDGLLVRHTCDNPSCCNPAHLLIGTHADNARDRDARGRMVVARGERRGSVKLTDEVVREIRKRCAQGESYSALARALGVTPPTIRMVALRRRWTHVAD